MLDYKTIQSLFFDTFKQLTSNTREMGGFNGLRHKQYTSFEQCDDGAISTQPKPLVWEIDDLFKETGENNART